MNTTTLLLLVLALTAGTAIIGFLAWRRKGIKRGRLQWCPVCRSKLERREVGSCNRLACTRCDYVYWNNPKPVTAILIPVDGGIVMVKRKFAPYAGSWCLPCGFMDPHESPEFAAGREVEEETGLKVKILQLLEIVQPPRRGVNEVVIFYLARQTGGSLEHGDDADDAAVFGPDDLPDDIPFTTHRRIIDDYFAGRTVGLPVRPAPPQS